jgi:hypothetical protein
VRLHVATASSFVAKVGGGGGEGFTHFHAVAVKHHSSMWNWLFGLQDEFFVINPFDVKENDEHALDFALHLFAFSVSVSLDFPFTAYDFFPNACLIIAGSPSHFSKISTKFVVVNLSNSSRNRISRDTRLQIIIVIKIIRKIQ